MKRIINLMGWKFFSVFRFLWLYVVLSSAVCHASHILYLNSFHPGFAWGDSILSGVRRALTSDASAQHELSVEYLDARYMDSPAAFRIFAQYLQQKYEQISLDAVIASDQLAADFVLQHRDLWGSHLPVVLCGYLHLESTVWKETEPYGLIENALDFSSSLELAYQMFPLTKQVVVLTSSENEMSADVARQFHDQWINERGNQYSVKELHDIKPNDLKDVLSHLDAETILFDLRWPDLYDDYDFLASRKNIEKLRAESNRPIFGFWEFQLGTGLVGGNLFLGRDQGEQAAQMAKRLSQHQDKEVSGYTEISKTFRFFDGFALQHFFVDTRKLPANSLVWFRQNSLITRKIQFLMALGILMAVGLMGYFLYVLYGIQRVEKRMLQMNMKKPAHEWILQSGEPNENVLPRNVFLNHALVAILMGLVLNLNPSFGRFRNRSKLKP